MKSISWKAVGLYFLFWTGLGVFLASQSYAQAALGPVHTPLWRLLGTWLAGMYLVALAAPLVLWLGLRYPFDRRNWFRRLVLHLPISIVWAAAELMMAAAVLPRLGVLPVVLPRQFTPMLFYLLFSSFHNNVFLYWEILAVQAAFRYYRGYRERERQAFRLELQTKELQTQLVRAQLNALKMQFQPHFLFNTLNAIMVLVRQQRGAQAEEMLARFSDLLRCVLDDVNVQEVPLRRELEYLRLYLSIEEVRFQDRLRVEIVVSPALLDAAVPHMSLQPIVENAIRHGIGKRAGAGHIGISATRTEGRLDIRVADDGPGFPADGVTSSAGIGLANTRERLRQLYGEGAQLRTENGAQGGAVVTLTIPEHQAPEVAEAEARAQFLTGGMVEAIAGGDFSRARSLSNEDRQARHSLERLREEQAGGEDAEAR